MWLKLHIYKLYGKPAASLMKCFLADESVGDPNEVAFGTAGVKRKYVDNRFVFV